MKEEWKEILDGRYRVSSFGNVESSVKFNGAKWLPMKKFNHKPKYSQHGYESIKLSANGKGTSHYIHRLIYESFMSAIPKHLVINHINGIKNDNRIENLEAISQRDNVYHSIEAKLKIGQNPGRNPGIQMTDENILTMLTYYGAGVQNHKIARHYKISDKTLTTIVNGWSAYARFSNVVTPKALWGHKQSRNTNQLNDWDVEEICIFTECAATPYF